MHTTDQKGYQYRPLGVALLAALYGLFGMLLVIAPLVALAAGKLATFSDLLAGVASIEFVLPAVVLCFTLAWGLWTLNRQVRIGIMLLAAAVMLTFASDLFNGNRLDVGIFGFALGQLIYLSYPDVSDEFEAG